METALRPAPAILIPDPRVTHSTLDNLFRPMTIGGVEVRNRIAMSALTMGAAGADGSVTDELIRFYVERARGGAGLITVGGAYPEPRGKEGPGMLGIHDDSLIGGYRRLTVRVRELGSAVFLQILHAGRYAMSGVTGLRPVAPSGIPSRLTGETPEELTADGILEVERSYGEAARRAHMSGFDGVEVLAGTGYLVSEFLSPATNRRTDGYGGGLENRMRFLVEVIEEIGRRVPGSFPIGVRISAEEYVEGGNTIVEARAIARRLEDLGVSYISVSAGWHESRRPIITREVRQGEFVPLARGIKGAVGIPVMAGVRIKDPVLADRIVGSGDADMVSMGRALIADPGLPAKAIEGRIREIRPCIACSHCLSSVFRGSIVECAVNPTLWPGAGSDERAGSPRRVLVVGAGPAGLEAAVTAASMGHRVVIADARPDIGGALAIASKPPYKGELLDLVEYYRAMIGRYGIELDLGREVDEGYVDEMGPDAVVVATGASPAIPGIPGVDLPHVRTAVDVLGNEMKLSGEVAVIGGGSTGLEAADYIADRGGRVSVVEMLDRVGSDLDLTVRWVLLGRLRERGVRMITGARVRGITPGSVVADAGGREVEIGADHVVLAVGMRPNGGLAERLRGRGYDVRAAGDCVRPAGILEAVRDGHRAAAGIG